MKKILFVCTENAGRSQMAEGFARHWASKQGLAVEAYSAGSRPSGKINPLAAEAMKEKEIDLSRQRSKGLEEVPVTIWDALVTMGCEDRCPSFPAKKRADWELEDPKGKDLESVRKIRDQIETKVKTLLEML